MKRHALSIFAAVLLLRAAMLACGRLSVRTTGPYGLELSVYLDEQPYQSFEPRASYFECAGFAFGNGWIGGMRAGQGQFIHSYWLLVIPYWFCGLAVVALGRVVAGRMRRQLRCHRGAAVAGMMSDRATGT